MLTALLFSQIVMAAPQEYKFSQADSLLYVKVYKRTDTIGAGAAHNHAIQAQSWHGNASWDASDATTCSFSFSVPVINLVLDKTKMRKIAGLKGEVSDSQRAEIKGNMLSEGQLNADKYPNISFASTSCEVSGDKVLLNGNFSLRGQTNSVKIPVTISVDDVLNIKGSFDVKATDYGFEPYSALFGAVANKDTMEIHFDLKTRPKAKAPAVEEAVVPVEEATPAE
jgi:polyisoprenoid-binding protein YceI